MRKEILLAIVIGLLVGLVLTYGFYLASSAMRRPPTNSPDSQTTQQQNPDPSAGGALSVVSPVDESVQTSQRVTIAGTTIANSFVVIFVNEEEHITTADSSGNFSIEAELDLGSNVITIHAIDEDGNKTVVERTVVVVTSETTDTATESASTP